MKKKDNIHILMKSDKGFAVTTLYYDKEAEYYCVSFNICDEYEARHMAIYDYVIKGILLYEYDRHNREKPHLKACGLKFSYVKKHFKRVVGI